MTLCKFDNVKVLRMVYKDEAGSYLAHFYGLGSAHDLKKYGYEISVKNHAGNEKICYSSSQLTSIDDSSLRIKVEEEGFVLGSNVVCRLFENEDSRFKFKFQLKLNEFHRSRSTTPIFED